MFQFVKFFSTQWSDIKGNAKWWLVVFIITTAGAIYETIKHASIIRIIIVLGLYFMFWAVVVFVWYKTWCKRDELSKISEGDRLASKKMQDWLKDRDGYKFKRPN
jgi:hypothetical protein